MTASQVEGIVWPPMATGMAASLIALMHQLESTERMEPEAIVEHQHRQLVQVATHALSHSPYFRHRLQDAGIPPGTLGTPEGLRRLPVMTRRDLQQAGDSLFCSQIPQTHAPVYTATTSGSSGEPVVVKHTGVKELFSLATTLREHIWHRRDFGGTLAAIRASVPPGRTDLNDWGPPVSLLFKSGPSHALRITEDVRHQAAWLGQVDPHYLLTYPTNLDALLHQCRRDGIVLPRLRQVRTVGETLAPGVREAVREIWNVGIADIYSAYEFGNIAFECPHSGLYHVMSECVIVEVLDEAGAACPPGETGRLVITDLLNFATPMVRYEIGDYAEPGPLCPCGRTLPTLNRIAGRQRNMVMLPDGRRHYPLVGFRRFRDIAPVRQYQLIQRDRERIEVRLVADAGLTDHQERRLGAVIRESLGYPFELTFVYFPDLIPRSRGGKFEEFVCEVANQPDSR